jgi:hypothetical protein
MQVPARSRLITHLNLFRRQSIRMPLVANRPTNRIILGCMVFGVSLHAIEEADNEYRIDGSDIARCS